MANDLFNDILYSLPIYRDNRTDNQFTLELSKLKKEYPQTTPKYEIDFKKPLTPIRKYYHKLISNESINLFNQISKDAERIDIPEEHSFLFLKHQKQVLSYFKNLSSYISERKLLDEFYLKPSSNPKSDEAYIIFYLKTNAIMLYLELQERFSILKNIEILSQEQIHELYFNETPPIKLFVSPYSGAKIIFKKNKDNKANQFKIIKGDLEFRPENQKILEYNKIIKKTDAFSRFEQSLYDNQIIDSNYNFITTKGNKQLLAAAIHQLILKEILNNRKFPGGIIIKEREITKFFSHRYGSNSDTDKEFRNFNNLMKHKLTNIIKSHSWIDKIN